MRYLSYYHEYPIHESAEGGYYYAGNELVSTKRLSKRQCKKKLEQITHRSRLSGKRDGSP